jgi:SpoVK/Ycf46/Vps4 family AAA+-type ATPase
VVCTSNDIAALPPEFSRAERFDATVFLDLPSSAEKDQIWAIHRARFGIPAEQARPDDTDWSGAEVRACCRLAALLGVPLTQAARQVVPVAVTAAERIAELRAWASGRCLSASVPGLYVHEPAAATPSARRIQRGQRN